MGPAKVLTILRMSGKSFVYRGLGAISSRRSNSIVNPSPSRVKYVNLRYYSCFLIFLLNLNLPTIWGALRLWVTSVRGLAVPRYNSQRESPSPGRV
jgi:hypothetical protein